MQATWSIQVRKAVARVNALFGDDDERLQVRLRARITLPALETLCRLDGCKELPRTGSEFCSREHADQHPWTVWDPDSCNDRDGVSRQCTNPGTIVRWVRPFPIITEHECKLGRWVLNEDRMPQCGDLDWTWRDEQHIPTTVEWYNAVTESPDGHQNDRWPDFEVCSKCMPVIPMWHLSPAARERLRNDERADEPYRTEVGDRVADYVPPTPPRRAHADGIKRSAYLGAVRAFTKNPDSPREIVALAKAALNEEAWGVWERHYVSGERVPVLSLDREISHDVPDERRTEADDALERSTALVLTTLTENQQDALRRIYWQRRSFQEAANDLGILKTTFQKRHDQAIAALRRYYATKEPRG